MNYRYYTYGSRCTELRRFDLTMCISTYLRDNIILFIMWVRGYMTEISFSIFHLNYRLIKLRLIKMMIQIVEWSWP